MTGFPISDDQKDQIDRSLLSLINQINLPGGLRVDPDLIIDSFQRLLDALTSPVPRPIRTVIDPDITLLEVSARGDLDRSIVGTLAHHGIRTVRDFARFTEDQISEIQALKSKRLAAIKQLMGEAGVKFSPVREECEWRRLNGGPIRLTQLLPLSVPVVLRSYGHWVYNPIAMAGIITFADYASVGRAGAKMAFGQGWKTQYYAQLTKVFNTIETPAY